MAREIGNGKQGKDREGKWQGQGQIFMLGFNVDVTIAGTVTVARPLVSENGYVGMQVE